MKTEVRKIFWYEKFKQKFPKYYIVFDKLQKMFYLGPRYWERNIDIESQIDTIFEKHYMDGTPVTVKEIIDFRFLRENGKYDDREEGTIYAEADTYEDFIIQEWESSGRNPEWRSMFFDILPREEQMPPRASR